MGNVAPVPADDGVTAGRLAYQASEIFSSVLRGVSRVALVGFPNYPNVGDSAIWLGQTAWLRRNRVDVVAVADEWSYRGEVIRSRLGPHGVVVLSGGGNFGDLYPQHQRLRERVLADFAGRPVVQFPQTLRFSSSDALSASRHLVNGHGALTILCRDRPSLDLCVAEYPKARALLCPDAAFCMDPPRRRHATQEILWLLRRDQEATSATFSETSVVEGRAEVDWADPSDQVRREWRAQVVADRAGHRLARTPGILNHSQVPLRVGYGRLASLRLRRGIRLLSRGQVVVTDRLHAHILCILLGIPHVLLDNSYGKLRGFHDLWTRDSPLVRWCDDAAEAEDLALALLGDATDPAGLSSDG